MRWSRVITRRLLIAGAVAALAATYAFLPLTAPPRYDSPDETSNAFFSRLFAERGTLCSPEPLEAFAPGMVHPRSVKVVGECLLPGGFIGMPVLYGNLAKAFGSGAIPFFTPIMAALGVLAWGLLVHSRFGERAGMAAAVLLAAQPAWWYAASRTMFPNVLFCSLLLLAAWLFLAAPKKMKAWHADAAAAGVLLGFALAVRPAEVYWVALGIGAAVVASWKRAPWVRLAVLAAFAVLALAPFLAVNASLYGGPFATGYGTGIDIPTESLPHGLGDRLLGPLRPLLFPLGFAPRTALANFWTYGVRFFWWWSALAACAGVAWAITKRRRRVPLSVDSRAFLASGLMIGVWLVLFYGSWTVQDNPDPTAVTIGTSYLRYWLPMFAFSTLPVALLAAHYASDGSRRRRSVLLALGAVYLATSAAVVFGAPAEGLRAVQAELRRYDAVVADVVRRTPPDAVIVADRADKFLFPERRVITPLRAESSYQALGALRSHAPLYYFGITLPPQDVAYLNAEKLPPLGLTIERVASYGNESLYLFR